MTLPSSKMSKLWEDDRIPFMTRYWRIQFEKRRINIAHAPRICHSAIEAVLVRVVRVRAPLPPDGGRLPPQRVHVVLGEGPVEGAGVEPKQGEPEPEVALLHVVGVPVHDHEDGAVERVALHLGAEPERLPVGPDDLAQVLVRPPDLSGAELENATILCMLS